MAILDHLDSIIKHVEHYKPRLQYNQVIGDIYEGNLLHYVLQALKKQLSDKAYEQVQHRIAPINILQRIIDKLSKIYQQEPHRRMLNGNDADSENLKWYEKQFSINEKMNVANEYFNMNKYTLVQPYLHKGKPRLRALPNDTFLPYSADDVDPTYADHIIIIDQQGRRPNGQIKYELTIYTDEEILMVDTDKNILRNKMAAFNNPEGINPFGVIPFSYVNKSPSRLIPTANSDTLQMTILLPVLLTDLNLVSMFTSFPIVWGMDVDAQDIERSPNAFWFFKSDPASEKKPEIGQLKPEADIEQTLSLIQTQLAFWLNSLGIRPGSIGKLGEESFASGISKMIDEMDTVEARKKQVNYFTNAENDLWYKMVNHIHPVWAQAGLIENRQMFTPGSEVEVLFQEQVPMFSRGELVAALKLEIEAGLTTQRRSIEKLNPTYSDKEIDELLVEIEEERSVINEEAQKAEAQTQAEVPLSGETGDSDGHSHSYSVDESGNGDTSLVDGHRHEIIGFKVQTANGHIHDLQQSGRMAA